MDPLEVLTSVIEGPLSEALGKLRRLIEEAAAGSPEAAALIEIVKSKLPAEVFAALSAEAIHAGVKAGIELFTNFKFGEPNPGAVALQ